MVMNIICVILQIRIDNFYVLGNRAKHEIINKYKNMVNCNFFVGAQPETLHKEQICNLYKQNYSVTDKADGDRCFVLIDEIGNIYGLDNNIQNVFQKDLKSHNYKNCLLDAEIVRNNSKIYFYIFDCLIINGMDIRGSLNFLLKKRIECVQQIISSVNSLSDFKCYEIVCKKFIYKNVFLGGEILLKNTNYKNDGLIFTPIDEPYPKTKKWSKLLKWKPGHLNTIDFYAIKTNCNKWQLYVQGEQQNNKATYNNQNNNNCVLFDLSKFFYLYYPFHNINEKLF